MADLSWRERLRMAQRGLKETTDLDTMIEKARDVLLAHADVYEYDYRDKRLAQIDRQRANSEDYCTVWAVNQLVKDELAMLDEATGLTKGERDQREAASAAQTRAFLGALNGLIRQSMVRT